jgi:hypothetical protein
MEAVSIEKRKRNPIEMKRVEQVKNIHTAQTGNAKQTAPITC